MSGYTLQLEENTLFESELNMSENFGERNITNVFSLPVSTDNR